MESLKLLIPIVKLFHDSLSDHEPLFKLVSIEVIQGVGSTQRPAHWEERVGCGVEGGGPSLHATKFGLRRGSHNTAL